MYRVLIVDDERLIREGLRTLIDWQAQGFAVIAVATDGVEALEFHQKEPADLIIADIRMPRRDGLELLTALRSAGDKTPVLVLSGFAEFEYAQKAARLGVVGYLLKPVDEEELIGHLATVRQELDAARFSALTLVRGTERVPESWNWGKWQVLLVAGLSSSGQPLALNDEAHRRIQGVLGDRGEVFVQAPFWGAILRHVYPKGHGSAPLARELATALEGSVTSFAAALGDVATRPVDVAVSARQAHEVLGARFFLTPGTITCQVPPAGPAVSDAELDGWSERLALVLEAGALPPLRPLLKSLGAALAGSLNEASVKEGFVAVVIGAIERYIGHEARSSTLRARTTAWVSELWKEPFLARLVEFLAVHLEQLLAQERGPDTAGLAQKMLDLLESRYAENLKLESLAEVFHYNSAYLGKLFRSKTGEYFNTALDKVRIRHAQRLLGEGLKVYQVAEMVGYKYVDYFHAKFKKYTGVSPSQYRADH